MSCFSLTLPGIIIPEMTDVIFIWPTACLFITIPHQPRWTVFDETFANSSATLNVLRADFARKVYTSSFCR